jgi:EpsI family protein
MVREGSFIHFGDDKLLVGDICGGLRSLIALLALGALVAYISPVKTWAKIALVLLAGPVAVLANIARIFFLCIVGYFYGSEFAAGKVHDFSGILIFAVAIVLFLMVEAPLRNWATRPETEQEASGEPATPLPGGGIWLAIAVVLLAVTTGGHVAIARAQARAAETAGQQIQLDIPARIVDYEQIGADAEIDDRTQELLETSLILIRDYGAPSRNRRIQLTVVHAGTTRRSLHFPEVCIVGSGYEIRDQYTAPVGVLFNARRLVLVQGDQSQAVLYWFKTGDSFTGNFFANAGYWALNQLMFKTPTSSLIKLATPIGPDGEVAAFNALEDFASKLTPELRSAIR